MILRLYYLFDRRTIASLFEYGWIMLDWRKRGPRVIINLEQTPLNRSQQLPAPYKRLIDEIKQN